MKKFINILIILLVVVGIFYFATRKEVVAPVATDWNAVEKTNVESYLRLNLPTLSPVPAVLGGTWYVVSVELDLEKDSGSVVYEDGHVQEKRSFTYTTDEKREVVSLIIK